MVNVKKLSEIWKHGNGDLAPALQAVFSVGCIRVIAHAEQILTVLEVSLPTIQGVGACLLG